jgi:hypothetical protein
MGMQRSTRIGKLVVNSVARMRLVKTENPTACITVNCKLCKTAIALYCL